MSSSITSISFDCHQPYALSRFWAEVLGFIEDPDDLDAWARRLGG